MPEIAPPMMLVDPLPGPYGLRYPPTDAPPARARSRLADRVPHRRPQTAADALQRARTPELAPPRVAGPPHASPWEPIVAAPPLPVAEAAPRSGPSVRRVLRRIWPGCEVVRAHPIVDLDVFRLVWEAHRSGALGRGDAGRAALAAVLLAAADDATPRTIVACEVRVGACRQAAFVDAHRGALLAWDGDPDVVLAGL